MTQQDRNNKEKVLISFSGGRTSAYMTKIMLEKLKDKYEMIVVFANTGEEEEATLEFIHKCDTQFNFNTVWIEAVTNPQHGKGVTPKIVNFKTANRDGKPFRDMVAKHGIPNQTTPHCSRELKARVIRAYAREIKWKKYYTAIGIRMDEIDRMSNNMKKERLIYPLVSLIPTTQKQINKFWVDMPFDLALKSYEGNCKVCWKKSLRKLLTIAKEHPERFEGFKKLEDDYQYFTPQSRKNNPKIKPPHRFFRGQLSVADILKMSKSEFTLVRDESKDIEEYPQTSLFGFDLDLSDGCIESCEVF